MRPEFLLGPTQLIHVFSPFTDCLPEPAPNIVHLCPVCPPAPIRHNPSPLRASLFAVFCQRFFFSLSGSRETVTLPGMSVFFPILRGGYIPLSTFSGARFRLSARIRFFSQLRPPSQWYFFSLGCISSISLWEGKVVRFSFFDSRGFSFQIGDGSCPYSSRSSTSPPSISFRYIL